MVALTKFAYVHRRYTFEDYLDLEQVTKLRHEYIQGYVYAMTGGTRNHARITQNISTALDSQLKGSGCLAYGSDMQIAIPNENAYLYPELSIVCGPEEIRPAGNRKETLVNPAVLVEVQSESTEEFDYATKRPIYMTIASLMDLIFVAQDRVQVTHWVRQDEGWHETIYTALEDSLALTIGVRLSLYDVYAHVHFEA